MSTSVAGYMIGNFVIETKLFGTIKEYDGNPTTSSNKVKLQIFNLLSNNSASKAAF
jgi:hypothetical protein